MFPNETLEGKQMNWWLLLGWAAGIMASAAVLLFGLDWLMDWIFAEKQRDL